MARHPDSTHTRSFDGFDRPRPVDAQGHCRQFVPVTARAASKKEDGSIGFKGHAAVFNSRTMIGSPRWGFWEELAPGCFKKTIVESDVRFLKNHDPNFVLARNKAGTLRLAEDAQGLAVDADMGNYSYSHDLAEALARGDMNQMSFAFDPITWERSEDPDGVPIIRHTEVRIFDVAVVAFPAYLDTDASLRTALALQELCRAAGIDPAEVQRFVDSKLDLHDLLAARKAERDGQPLDGTGTAANTPPAETTDVPFNPHFRMAQLRLAELAASFQ